MIGILHCCSSVQVSTVVVNIEFFNCFFVFHSFYTTFKMSETCYLPTLFFPSLFAFNFILKCILYSNYQFLSFFFGIEEFSLSPLQIHPSLCQKQNVEMSFFSNWGWKFSTSRNSLFQVGNFLWSGKFSCGVVLWPKKNCWSLLWFHLVFILLIFSIPWY